MKKYIVTVAYSILQSIEVEAETKDDAADIAFPLFDQDNAVLGEGEVLEVFEIKGV
jgi:hypothetical protein